MKTIDSYINDLLLDYNCVIIPGLGGFLANYEPAKINSSKHIITPPSKHIIFNKNLNNNDGLLANSVVRNEKIEYSEAVKKIDKFVSETTTRLKKGEEVKIDKVGFLKLDRERNIQFKPSGNNFLAESFGLSEIQAVLIKQDTVIKKVEKELKTESAKLIDLKASSTSKMNVNYKRIISLAASLALIAGVFWISLKTDILHNVNYSNLNPFAHKAIVNDTIVIHSRVYKKEVEIEPNTAVADTFASAVSEAPVPVTAEIIIKSENKTELKEEKKLSTKKIDDIVIPTKPEKGTELYSTKKFHLVTGCFQIEENALKYVAELSEKNIKSEIIGKNKQGLFVVSCGDFNSKSEADKNLNMLREALPNAWLYKSR